MQTVDQIAQDLQVLFKHMEYECGRDDVARHVCVSEDAAKALLWKPQPFEFAKLEQWKPSKHANK